MRHTFWILLAGCTSPSMTTPCGTATCSSDEVCDHTDPAGPTCIAAAGDLDGDGIPNAMDFCEHAPGGMYDEDGDGIGDECDRCPIAPPPQTPDPDGDAVDAPCDPDSHTPGDSIVAFSGFHDLPATWKAVGTWMVDGGDLVVTPADTMMAQTLTVPISTPSNHLAVLAQWKIDGFAGVTDTYDVAVAAVDRRPASVAQMHCGALRDTIGDHLRLDTDNSTSTKDLTNLFDLSQGYRVAAAIDGVTASCALIGPKTNGAVDANVSPGAMSEADLVVRATKVRFGYVLVIARQ